MARTLNRATAVLTTSEADIYTAPSDSKAMSLLVQAVNNSSNPVSCEIWVTDGSNTHDACLFPTQSIAAYSGLSDTAKHIIPANYKIRGVAGAGSVVYVEVSVVEGV